MSGESREAKAEHIRRLLATEGAAVAGNTRAFNEGRYDAVADLDDYEELKERARAIKEDAIERLPELLDELEAAVEANGGHVHFADDAAEAREIVRAVAADRDADTVVKSKSMTSEELGIGEALAAESVDVWETDLGEFVLQVAEEAPSHIVAPAIHRSRESIAALFDAHFDLEEPPETADELTRFAREFLGERIAAADVGLTGANFVAADTGTMALVTSEGNARKCVAAPDTHVAVAGVEKVVPTVADLQPFVELIGRSGTGQDVTSYVSLFRPPVDSPPVDFERPDVPMAGGDERGDDLGHDDPGGGHADRAFHLVLVDNGRMAMRADDDLRETLYCIRCSACLNSCANFQHVGGHAFGGETYSGGIATGWEAGVHGRESAAEFNDLCTGCTRCVNQCPVEIDVPWINTAVRDRVNRGADPSNFDFVYEGLTPDEEPGGLDRQKRLFGNVGALARLGSATAPVSNWVARSRPARAVLDRVAGVDPRRDLPEFRRETLRSWFERRDERGPRNPDREVVLYPDTYTNHVLVERGKAAVRLLEALGVAVRVPDAGESGRAPLSQGMVATARGRAEGVAADLEPHLDVGRDVVVIEPSDLAMIRDDYERLLDEERFERLSARSYELFEYVYGLLAADGTRLDRLPLAGADLPDAVAYHAHCQQRTLGLAEYTVAVLEDLGVDVATSDAECCGMAGSFGYKREYYDLAMAVGESLVDDLAAKGAADRTVVASGTSCQEQLGDLLEDQPRHPAELLAPGDPQGE